MLEMYTHKDNTNNRQQQTATVQQQENKQQRYTICCIYTYKLYWMRVCVHGGRRVHEKSLFIALI